MNNTMVLLTKQNSGVCQALLVKSYKIIIIIIMIIIIIIEWLCGI